MTSTKSNRNDYVMEAIVAIADRFHENCYDAISLSRQLLEPEGFVRSDMMTIIGETKHVLRLTIFERKGIWVVLNYSDSHDEVMVFVDEKSYRGYVDKLM
jgi:hypothetical protein